MIYIFTPFISSRINNESPVALQSSTHYDLSKFKPSPYITDHGTLYICLEVLYYYKSLFLIHDESYQINKILILVVPDASKYLLSKVTGVKTVEVTAKFPVVEGLFFYHYLLHFVCTFYKVIRYFPHTNIFLHLCRRQPQSKNWCYAKSPVTGQLFVIKWHQLKMIMIMKIKKIKRFYPA